MVVLRLRKLSELRTRPLRLQFDQKKVMMVGREREWKDTDELCGWMEHKKDVKNGWDVLLYHKAGRTGKGEKNGEGKGSRMCWFGLVRLGIMVFS